MSFNKDLAIKNLIKVSKLLYPQKRYNRYETPAFVAYSAIPHFNYMSLETIIFRGNFMLEQAFPAGPVPKPKYYLEFRKNKQLHSKTFNAAYAAKHFLDFVLNKSKGDYKYIRDNTLYSRKDKIRIRGDVDAILDFKHCRKSRLWTIPLHDGNKLLNFLNKPPRKK